jgi:hypothetical protein
MHLSLAQESKEKEPVLFVLSELPARASEIRL